MNSFNIKPVSMLICQCLCKQQVGFVTAEFRKSLLPSIKAAVTVSVDTAGRHTIRLCRGTLFNIDDKKAYLMKMQVSFQHHPRGA